MKGWQFFLLAAMVVSAPHTTVRTAILVSWGLIVVGVVCMLVGV